MAGTALQFPMKMRAPFRSARLGIVLAVLVISGPPCALAGQTQNGMHRAQKHESRHEIDQAEDSWRAAMLKLNTVQLAGLLADDYMGITPSGTLQSKDDTLANLRDGRMKFTTLDISDRKVRFYGATALVTSVAEIAGSAVDGPVAGSFRYTHVYVRNAQGAWKIVSFEASKMREPGDHGDRAGR